MTKNELQSRVDARRQEIDGKDARITELTESIGELQRRFDAVLGDITDFVNDIKGRSTLYALIKNLPFWKKLEELIKGGD